MSHTCLIHVSYALTIILTTRMVVRYDSCVGWIRGYDVRKGRVSTCEKPKKKPPNPQRVRGQGVWKW